jgi:hypothetical protein
MQSSQPPQHGRTQLKYKYRETDPFIFTYGCDLHHRPYTTPKLMQRRKLRKYFDPRRYSYRKDHGGLLYVAYQPPKGWDEVVDEETGETLYFNTLTSTFQIEKPFEEANIDDLTSMHYDIDIQLGSTLPRKYPRYLKERGSIFVEEVEILGNNYKNKVITRKEYFEHFYNLLSKFDYKRGITYICPLCNVELFDGITECINEQCIKKCAIMQKSQVDSKRWTPFIKPRKKFQPKTFHSLKKRRNKKTAALSQTSSSLSMGSLSGGSSLGANINLIKGDNKSRHTKNEKQRNTKRLLSKKAMNSSSYLSSKSSSKQRIIPRSRIITNSMSIDDVEHNYMAPHSIETLNAFQDKTSFSSSVMTSQLHEGLQNNDLSLLSTNNFSTICSEESSLGFTMNNKIGTTPSESTLMNLHDKRAFVTYSDENENRPVTNRFNSKLGVRVDEESDSHIVASQQNQKDPYLLTRPFQGFNTLDVGEDEENDSIKAASLPPAMAYFNEMRLGNIFCLWCGAGPMSSMCKGKKCIALHKAEIHLTLPKAVRNLFKRHVGLCKKHNHIFPRGECKGRCPDCGGCNQGDACEHYNVSGGAKHPSPDGTEEWPLCSKIDGSRCFKENFYQVVDPHFNRSPTRIQTAPSPKRSRIKKSKSSIGSISGNDSDGIKSVSRPSTSSSNSRPNSRSGDNSTTNSRPNSKKAKSRPHSRARKNKNSNDDINTGMFRTKFTPVKKFPKNKISNTVPNKWPSSRSSLKRMFNKNSRTLSHIRKKGHRNKYLVRPKSSPMASLTTKQGRKKERNRCSSNSSLILMQNDLFGGSNTSSNSSSGNSYVGSKHSVRSPKNIEIRPPFVKTLKKTTEKNMA